MAPRSKLQAEEISRKIAEAVRRRALRALADHDRTLTDAYRKIAEGIRRDLRATGFTVDQVERILRKHFDATAPERIEAVQKAILDAAREARTLDRATFERMYGKEEVANAPPPLGRSSARAQVRSLKPRKGSEDK